MGATTDPISIITELAENGSLYDVIHKRPAELADFKRVINICIDAARGIQLS